MCRWIGQSEYDSARDQGASSTCWVTANYFSPLLFVASRTQAVIFWQLQLEAWAIGRSWSSNEEAVSLWGAVCLCTQCGRGSGCRVLLLALLAKAGLSALSRARRGVVLGLARDGVARGAPCRRRTPTARTRERRGHLSWREGSSLHCYYSHYEPLLPHLDERNLIIATVAITVASPRFHTAYFGTPWWRRERGSDSVAAAETPRSRAGTENLGGYMMDLLLHRFHQN